MYWDLAADRDKGYVNLVSVEGNVQTVRQSMAIPEGATLVGMGTKNNRLFIIYEQDGATYKLVAGDEPVRLYKGE